MHFPQAQGLCHGTRVPQSSGSRMSEIDSRKLVKHLWQYRCQPFRCSFQASQVLRPTGVRGASHLVRPINTGRPGALGGNGQVPESAYFAAVLRNLHSAVA
jgi:hypothetical protein